MSQFRPTDIDELRQCVAWAAGEEQALELVGAGTKRAVGRPLQVPHTLELGALAGIRSYEPSELVLVAGAGTPLAEIEKTLGARNQMLAFEPPDWGALLAAGKGGQTIGGVVAGNLAGPRRIKSGAARDHFLGFTGVSGRGEVFKGGGQVVKNVTGYDLPKLMAGSWGTLAALAEVTLKVLPQPEEARTVVVLGLDDATATRALAGALNSRHEISGAAHLPAPVAARSAIGAVAEAGRGVTALRLEGPAPSVAHRAEAVRGELAAFGASEELAADDTALLWREVADLDLFRDEAASTIWRVSVAPSAGAAVAAAIAAALDATWFFDWGGGLLWVAVRDGAGDGGEALLRNAVRAAGGGHATLLRGPESLRAAIAVFEPQPAPVAALTARVKDAFDPRRILNPGRVYRGC